MDNNLARVDQHPVTLGQSFDARSAIAFVLERLDKMVGYGADMPLRGFA